ncbi:hypothetical protein PHABIO_69 [Pseudomonas phage Phabio]|uniref:Uncharacterized protein n=1 Tax=Pseudomonas phage Phabio TaxID=2006668 RepID=A0A1Y0STQ5_9CAUD|nr:hypothetical protein MZD05_gp069 [Pseudomonas phage Phabio]ARV76700.1 hypothetical protein PHABIO_69 [Pseudomonas phage Phabio]
MTPIIDPEKQLEESIDVLIDRLDDCKFNPNTGVIEQTLELLELIKDAPRRCEIAGANTIANYFQEAFK